MLVAAGCALLVVDLVSAHDLKLPHGAMVGRDFLNAWAGGKLTLAGQVGSIYSLEAYLDELRRMVGQPLDFHAFSYPPTLLLFLWPLGLLGYVPALLLWIGVTGAAFVVAARPYLARSGLPSWIAALLPASMMNIWAGHHGFVLAALWLAAFALLPRRPVVAGLLVALLTCKPHMGVLIALLLLVRGEWRTIAAAAAGTIGLILLSAALFGWTAWANYLAVTAGVQAALLAEQAGFFLRMMPTPYVSFWLASGSVPLAVAAQAAFAAAALWVLVRSALRATEWPELGLMAATATFIVLPYAFNYDMAVVGLAAAILLYGKSAELRPWERLCALLALAAPIAVLATNSIGLPLLPFALLGFLLAQERCYAGSGTRSGRLRPAAA